MSTFALLNHPILRQARSRLGKVRRELRSRPSRTLRQKKRLLTDTSLTADERDLLKQVDALISPNDGMYVGNGNHYYRVGLSAIDCVERVMKAANVPRITNALDLPCGHGRVLRFLVKRFPETRFTACDLDRDGVDFCKAVWDVDTVYSQVNLNELSLGRQFDFIWSGSLITHLDDVKITSLFDFFAQHLSVGGLLVFTAAGDRVAQWMVTGHFDYGINRSKIPEITQDYKATGYGYTDYPYRPEYGISLTSQDWINKQIQRLNVTHTISLNQPGTQGALREIFFEAHAWDNHQDVYGYLKV